MKTDITIIGFKSWICFHWCANKWFEAHYCIRQMFKPNNMGSLQHKSSSCLNFLTI